MLEAVRRRGAITRAELAADSAMSVATISRAVTQLLDAGILVEQSEVGVHGGRPLGRVSVHDRTATVLAVDVADRHTSIAVIDLGGALVSEQRYVDPPRGADQRLAHTLRVVTEHWAAARREHRAVAVGIAIPGPVQADGNVDFAPALQWHGIPLGDLLRQRLGAPVAVGNDANLIAVAESRFGAYRESASLVALAVFEGIGAGIVEGGALIEGSRGFGGQIGRMLMGRDSIERWYVDFGDLESQLGSIGLEARARAADIDVPAGSEVFAELFVRRDEDGATGEFVARVFDEFAVGLANVVALLDPETIVLAGRFAALTDVVVPELERRLTGRVLHVPALVPPSTPIDGALLGAAAIALDAFGPLDQLLVD